MAEHRPSGRVTAPHTPGGSPWGRAVLSGGCLPSAAAGPMSFPVEFLNYLALIFSHFSTEDELINRQKIHTARTCMLHTWEQKIRGQRSISGTFIEMTSHINQK